MLGRRGGPALATWCCGTGGWGLGKQQRAGTQSALVAPQ